MYALNRRLLAACSFALTVVSTAVLVRPAGPSSIQAAGRTAGGQVGAQHPYVSDHRRGRQLERH